MDEKKAAAVLFCQQSYLDVPLSDSWLLKDLGDGKNYLEKVIRRLQVWHLFSKIYIVVGESDEYAAFRRYGSADVKVVHMSRADFYDSPHSESKCWNWASNMSGFIATWLYQIQLAFNEDIVFFATGSHVFHSKKAVEKALHSYRQNSDAVFFLDYLGQGGGVVDKDFLAPSFEKKLHGHRSGHLIVPKDAKPIYLSESGDIVQYNNSICYPVVDLGLNRRQNFFFMKKFYQANHPVDEAYFMEAFRPFYQANKGLLENLPLVARITAVDRQTGQEINLSILQAALEQIEQIGRLTVVFMDLTAHSELDAILDLLKKNNLHYYLETDGQYDVAKNEALAHTFDVIKFLFVDEIDIALLQKKHPQLDAALLFNNLSTIMNISHKCPKPQVGIDCNLSDNDVRNIQIINHWKLRTSYIPDLSIQDPHAKFYPQIQFVCYHQKLLNEHNDKYLEFAKKELLLSVDGKWNGLLSVENSKLSDYLASHGALKID